MLFENEKLKCKFWLPDPFCLRHAMRYEAARDLARDAGAQFAPTLNWLGAIALFEDWECEHLEHYEDLTADDLAEVHGVVMQIVMWVGAQVAAHVMSELFVPKN